MDIRAVHRGLRSGLVALLLLAGALGWAQPSPQQPRPQQPGQPAGQSAGVAPPALRGWEEISQAQGGRAVSNPVWLLLLAPGLLFLLHALLGPRFFRRLPLLLLLPLLLAADSPEPERLVREAEGLFAAGKYASALQRYRQAAELLPDNPVLLYDLALSAHRAGERGYAIAYMRRAVSLDPRDRAARAALAGLEQAYELPGQVPMPLPLDPDLPFFLTIGFANLTLVMAALVARRGRVRRLIALVLAAVFTAASLGLLVARLASEARPVGVLAARARLLRVPEPDSKVWLELPAGTALHVRGRAGTYALVETGSQLKGWVAEERILLD